MRTDAISREGRFEIWFDSKNSGKENVLHGENTRIGHQCLIIDDFGEFWRHFFRANLTKMGHKIDQKDDRYNCSEIPLGKSIART